MDYPLGSFPRFGHQERWAQERRARAIANSAITRKNNAVHYLNVEMAFFNWLIRVTNSMTPQNEKGKNTLAKIQKKVWEMRTKLESGNRVYFKRLGRLLHTVAVSADVFPHIHHLDHYALATLAENIGNAELIKMRQPNL